MSIPLQCLDPRKQYIDPLRLSVRSWVRMKTDIDIVTSIEAMLPVKYPGEQRVNSNVSSVS